MSKCFQARAKTVAGEAAGHQKSLSLTWRETQQGDQYNAVADRLEQQANQVADQFSRAGVAGQQYRYPQPDAALPAVDHVSNLAPTELNVPGTAQEQHAHRIAGVGGAPLHADHRSMFAARFKRDFSQVRVHADSQAASAAEAIQARAYTLGSHIVFGRGEYVPHQARGSQLLAHELTHVVQQQGQPRALQRDPTPEAATGTMPEGEAVPASDQDRREFVQLAIEFMTSGADFYRLVTVDEERLHRTLDGLKGTIDNNLSIVRDFLNNDQTLTTQLTDAYRQAITALVNRAAEQLDQTTHQIYQGNRQRIHESAWPRETTDPAAHSLSAALPESERQRITVLTTDFSVADLHDLFSTETARTTIPLPANTTVAFAGAIDERLQHGLQNVAASIQPDPLALNTTITLALDLEPYGGSYSAYRFTHVEHRPRGRPRTRELLIERLGNIGIEGLTASQLRAQQQRFGQFNFSRGSGWDDDEFEALLSAMQDIPDSILTQVDGLTFDRDSVHPDNADVGGDYDPDDHTVTIFDRAFNASMTRVGTPGTSSGIQRLSVFTVTHEIGHAIDLRPLRLAWNDLQAASNTLHAAFQQFENPPGSRNYTFPSSQQARFNQLNQLVTQARQALQRARAVSGARKQRVSGVWEIQDVRAGGARNPFRIAARADGAVFPTDYPNPAEWWQEYFAEAFALYTNSPTVLEQTRPNVYAFFVANFPT